MATVTLPHSRFPGLCVDFDVNTANWKVSQVRAVNSSDHYARAIISKDGVVVLEVLLPPHTDGQWNVAGVQLAWDETEGGLVMGPYVLAIQFPAEV